MKTPATSLFLVLLIALFGCNDPKTLSDALESTESTASSGFELTVTQNSAYTNLPELQSFVFATYDSYWLMFGGRTNGFHGFGADEDFPFDKANQYVYVYDTSSHTLDSLTVLNLPATLKWQFTSTNMNFTRVDDNLYMTGGYGVIVTSAGDTNFVTHPIISRVAIPQMITAVLDGSTDALEAAIVYDSTSYVQSTGGELFKLADSNFYLTVGHNFTGLYSDFIAPNDKATQVYLDAVRIFTLNETATSISVTETDSLYEDKPDSTTQFRRRDLVSVPIVQSGTVGIALYGGVFRFGPAFPWQYPIFITGGTKPFYTIDNSYTQATNIYATANMGMYDSSNDVMYTTAFGGIGADTSDTNNTDFTDIILTIVNANGSVSSLYNDSTLSTLMGSEAIFIPDDGVTMYNADYNIIDFNSLASGSTVLLGKIYGGIVAVEATNGSSAATNLVYDVHITKD